jgi:hypothetical protein
MVDIAIKLSPYKERAAELAIGLSANSLIGVLFDWFLYPAVIYWLGLVYGGVVMTLLSMLACLAMMKFYDWSKRDWLGIEAIKGIKDYEGKRKLGYFTSWIMKKSDPAVFLFMTIKFDPFITTAYMRNGKFNGLSHRDWRIFIGSLILGNIYWTLACYMGISLFEWVWKAIT